MRDFDSSPDLVNGYPLARSILAKDLRMIRLFLKYGARLDHKNFLVVDLAIRLGDLGLIRVLIEPGFKHPIERMDRSKNWGDQIKLSASRSDRIKVTDQMLERAIKFKNPSIIQYFIDKGPTLEAIRLIENL
ncbi:hypothetical protein BY996DRAFT_8295385 [Phakopsora pachyrhizi]|nr:hypothetical protein BY996DRAFT_8295385 [Phakopsora pachyrhizi]